MRLAIHQPEHLPWLGYFAKMAAADAMVVLDSVPYRHHYFQNRNRLAVDGTATWLTVPVLHRHHLSRPISEIRVAPERRWRRRYLGRLRDATRSMPHAADAVPDLEAIVEAPHERLVDLNMAIISRFAAHLGIAAPLSMSSDHDVVGTRSLLLAELCHANRASTYLSGPSGREYLDPAPFEERGIGIEIFEFSHPRYPQPGPGFVPNLAIVDLVANAGVERSRQILESAVASSRCVALGAP